VKMAGCNKGTAEDGAERRRFHEKKFKPSRR